MPPFFTCTELNTLPATRHGFFTRKQEGSSHDYKIMENRAIAMRHMGLNGEDLCIVEQKHTPDVITVEANWDIADTPIADAMVTATPGLMLGILTADCTPVLFADNEARVIGAAHAGWKGAKAGVLENTLQAMAELGASISRIHVALGPCIQQSSYEIGPEFYESFLADDLSNRRFFIPSIKAGHFMFDMPGFVTARLEAAGVSTITNLHRDTCSDEEHFFSYRRCCLRGEVYKKNGLSVIGLR